MYKKLVALSNGIGLQVQSSECAAYSTNSEATLTVVEEHGVRFVSSAERIMVAGMPVGSDAFANMRTMSQTRQCDT